MGSAVSSAAGPHFSCIFSKNQGILAVKGKNGNGRNGYRKIGQ